MKVEWELWVEDIQPGTPEYEKVRQLWLEFTGRNLKDAEGGALGGRGREERTKQA